MWGQMRVVQNLQGIGAGRRGQDKRQHKHSLHNPSVRFATSLTPAASAAAVRLHRGQCRERTESIAITARCVDFADGSRNL